MLNHIKGFIEAILFTLVLSLGSCTAPEPAANEQVIPKDVPTCNLCEFTQP